MKKLVAIILTLMLCVGVAFADETSVEINWADLEEEGAETIALGDFVAFDEIALKMWVPSVFEAVELSDDDKAQGYIGYYLAADGSAITAMYFNAGVSTLEEYKELVAQSGATDMEDVIVNGIPAIDYTITESDTVCLCIADDAGNIFAVSGAPVSDEGMSALLIFVMASVQAA